MANNRELEITLRLTEIDHLFRKPEISPLSADYQEYSYIAGIEYLSNELYANPTYKAVRLTIQLPPEQVTPELESQTRAAIARYCRGRLQDVSHEIRQIRWRGTRALGLALVAFFVLIGVSRLMLSEESLFRQIISEGLAIGAWVSLWVPLEMLIFQIWEHRLDRNVYTRLSELELRISSNK